jgi:hypothetical protein
MNLPELPYDNIHKFLAAVGFILILGALFIEPVYIESEKIRSIGGAAVALGLIGWGFEQASLSYLRELDQKGTLSTRERRRGQRWSKVLLALRFVFPIIFVVILFLYLY